MASFQKEINTVNLLFTSISCMLGSGWLLSSGYASQIAGYGSVYAWLIGGIMILVLAHCFAQLAISLPITGGIARYTEFTHGRFTSYLIGCSAWLSCVAAAPTEVEAIIRYLADGYPGLIYVVNNDAHLSFSGGVLSVILLAIFTYINLQGIRLLIEYNKYLATWKLCIPIIVIITLIIFPAKGHNEVMSQPWEWKDVFRF